MNSVRVDMSKGKRMIAVIRPFCEVVAAPFEVGHTVEKLQKLADYLKALPGETLVVMEYTGRYFELIANSLCMVGLFVSVVHALRLYNYGKDSIRRVKTAKADALRIAGYGFDKWAELAAYNPAEDLRIPLKNYNRQYNHYTKLKVMLKNNLIALLVQTLPD